MAEPRSATKNIRRPPFPDSGLIPESALITECDASEALNAADRLLSVQDETSAAKSE